MTLQRTVCPYDCPDCCGLLARLEQGKVVGVEGDPGHGFTRGTLCPKMAHYERTVYSPRRILTPLRRTGEKGEGKFATMSWEDALAVIAEKWKNIQRESGGEAILPYSYAGTMGILQYRAYYGLFYALGASELKRTICAPAKAYGWSAVMGSTLATRPQEAQQSDLILLWSLNMLSTNIHFKHDVDIARKRGAEVWCIDTYASRTARYADHFIRTRPGTDGALALGILHILRREGLVDADFLREHVIGWNELAETVLPRYFPARTAEITAVPEQDLLRLARAYGKAHAPFIRLGSGQSRYVNGSMTTRLITCLPAAVGAYKKPGGGMLASAAGGRAFDRESVTLPELRRSDRRIINMCTLGNALLEKKAPPIRSLFVFSSNPACTAPDQNKVLQGLSREDLFTVVHERFLTDTAKYADIVLPATTSLEHSDLYASYGHYTVQMGRAVIPPLGESRSNWQTACLLAQALGISHPAFKKTEDEIIEGLIAHSIWPLPLDKESLSKGLPVELSLPEDYKMDFRTPSGKIEVQNDRETPSLPDYFPPHGDEGEFWLINAPDPRVLDSSFNEREELARGNIMVLLMHPEDASRLGLGEGQRVTAWNGRGHADFILSISNCTSPGCVVTEGIWWREHVLDHSVNVLSSQRLTDKAGGSTFYDICVNVKASGTGTR